MQRKETVLLEAEEAAAPEGSRKTGNASGIADVGKQ